MYVGMWMHMYMYVLVGVLHILGLDARGQPAAVGLGPLLDETRGLGVRVVRRADLGLGDEADGGLSTSPRRVIRLLGLA